MDLRRLEALVAVARTGSVSGAANSLNCGQPTLSHHLRRLEDETGAVLLQRVGRGIRLTPDGERLAQRGEEILALLRRAEGELEASTQLASGHIRLAAFPSACSVMVPPLLQRLAESVPGLSVELVEAEPPEAAELLRAGRVDIALTFAYTGQHFGDDICVEYLGWDSLYLLEAREITDSEYPQKSALAHIPQISANYLRELQSTRWIAGCERCRTGLLGLCESVGFSPKVSFSSDDIVAVQALVAAQYGVTVLPQMALRAHRHSGVKVSEIVGAGRELHVATFGQPPRPAVVEEVAQTLLEVARDL